MELFDLSNHPADRCFCIWFPPKESSFLDQGNLVTLSKILIFTGQWTFYRRPPHQIPADNHAFPPWQSQAFYLEVVPNLRMKLCSWRQRWTSRSSNDKSVSVSIYFRLMKIKKTYLRTTPNILYKLETGEKDTNLKPSEHTKVFSTLLGAWTYTPFESRNIVLKRRISFTV